MTIDYDALKLAEEITEASSLLNAPDWCEAEGIDYEGMMRFALEAAEENTYKYPETRFLPPHGLTMFGIIYGLRLANLIALERKDSA